METVKHAQRIVLTLLAVMLVVMGLSPATAADRDEFILYVNDVTGSAVAAYDESGNLCWEETYTPYGSKTVRDDFHPLTAGCGSLTEERGFTGHTEDIETDLVYMQQRYYDPTIGRFLSMDPVSAMPGVPQSVNRYAYGNNSPYNYTDPDGRAAKLPIGM